MSDIQMAMMHMWACTAGHIKEKSRSLMWGFDRGHPGEAQVHVRVLGVLYQKNLIKLLQKYISNR